MMSLSDCLAVCLYLCYMSRVTMNQNFNQPENKNEIETTDFVKLQDTNNMLARDMPMQELIVQQPKIIVWLLDNV